MKRIAAIAMLTFREGIRMRIVLVFLVVLIVMLLRMPFALRGDETLAGRLQNFLSYSLGALSVMLSLATVFFSCATLSSEFRLKTLHLLVTKPVSRLEILVGKWFGVNMLNLLILLLCGAAIYGLAFFIKSRPVAFERDRLKLQDVVWTARAASEPTLPAEQFLRRAGERVRDQMEQGVMFPGGKEVAVREEFNNIVKRWRNLQPGEARLFEFDGLTPPESEDTVYQVRYKIIGIPAPPDEMVEVWWRFCEPGTNPPRPLQSWVRTKERSTEVHQFLVRAGVVKDGRAALVVMNPAIRPMEILFDGEDSLQVLYKVDSFEANFARALVIVFLRLALLAAVGVFCSVFVSFPVACLCAASFYLICLGMPFWMESMGSPSDFAVATHDPWNNPGMFLRALSIPVMQFFFPDFSYYDGASKLVDGVYISYGLLGEAALHTIVFGAVLLFIPGWLLFIAREPAEVQV